MNKTGIIGIVIIICVMFIALTLETTSQRDMRVTLAKTGLEECPKSPETISQTTIWVKDCSKYLEDRKKFLKEVD